MPEWSNVIPDGQAYREPGTGLFASAKPIPGNDVLERCRALTCHDIRRIVALDVRGWTISAEYVAGSAFYKTNPYAALNLILPGLPPALREIVWRGSWLTEEEVAALPYEQLIAASAQVIKQTQREKSVRDLALAAAEELGLSPELIARLTGEQ